MKIAIFFDGFAPVHEPMNPAQLCMGFAELGISSIMVTLPKAELRTYDSPFSLLQVSRRDVADPSFWRRLEVDVAVLFTWFRPQYLDILAAVRQADTTVVARPDTDGRVAPPVSRRYFTIPPPRFRQMPRWIAGRLLWRLCFGRREAYNLVRTLISSDAVIVETPRAMANLVHILLALKRADLIDRLWQIPVPIAADITRGPVGPKENVVAAIGRWDDLRQKNTMMMVRVLMGFLTRRLDYRAVLVGSGAALLKQLLSAAPVQVRERIKVTGFLTHAEVGRILPASRILFMPSIMEAGACAAAEAVCAGCSVVGTPIESLQYLSMGGSTGTLASDFTYNGLLAALLSDAKKWDRGEYFLEDIASRWRGLLDRKVVAQRFLDMLTQLTTE